MAAVSDLCFDIISLLVENIEPKVYFNINVASCQYDNENELGVICMLQFLESLRHSNHYIRLNDDRLYQKLVDLANEILLADFGEVCTFQNYLFVKIDEICQRLKPDHNMPVKVDKLVPESLPTQVDINVIDVVCEHPISTLECDDPIYIRIAELLNSIAAISAKTNFSAAVDDIVDSLDVKHPVRCKSTFLNRLRNVKDAVNLISESDNDVIYTGFLKYQIDEIYTLLKKDIFYDNDFSILAECKIIFLTLFEHVKALTKEKLVHLITMIKGMFAKAGELFQVSSSTEENVFKLKTNCKKLMTLLSSIALVLLNCFVLWPIITV